MTVWQHLTVTVVFYPPEISIFLFLGASVRLFTSELEVFLFRLLALLRKK
jgi:hypothetical protein